MTYTCECGKSYVGEITYTPVVPHTAGEWENDESGYKVKKCTVTSVEDGETTFTATVYDADGNVIEETSQTLTSNAGVFEIIADFFEKIFGFLLSLFK